MSPTSPPGLRGARSPGVDSPDLTPCWEPADGDEVKAFPSASEPAIERVLEEGFKG